MSKYDFFNQSFCSKLEYALTEAFKKFNEPRLKGIWCDGIQHDQLSTDKLLRDKAIRTTAWIGKDGQTKYDLLILLGERSLEKITKKEDLESCIPSKLEDGMSICLEDRVVEVRLT